MRRLCLLVACAALGGVLAAQGEPRDVEQVLVPKDVYVGDTAQLRYSFTSAIDFFAEAAEGRVQGGSLFLDSDEPVFVSWRDQFSVAQAVLRQEVVRRPAVQDPAGGRLAYTLIVTFVPWEPGSVDFVEFDLRECVRRPLHTEEGAEALSSAAPFLVDIAPVPVASLADKMGALTLRPPAGPLTLPGTNYVVWALVVLGLAVVAVLVVAVFRFRVVVEGAFGVREYVALARNAWGTRRRLRRLGRAACSDADFAREWQHLMRAYLSGRFGTPFASVATSRIFIVICNVTGDMLSAAQEHALLPLVSLFIRTDYILFAGGSLDAAASDEHRAAFASGEREKLLAATFEGIAGLEARAGEAI